MPNVSVSIYVLVVALNFLFIILAALTHELGHLVWFARHNRKAWVKFKLGAGRYYDFDMEIVGDYKGMSKEEYKDLYLMGIYAGLIPLIAAAVYNFYFIFLFAIYLYWCKWDIRAYREVNDGKLIS